MLFNSTEFLLFLPAVFAIYWLLRNRLRWQNLFVVSASYLFYGWWDWKFLILIAFTSACSFASGLVIGNVDSRFRKAALWANIGVNLAILALFKYYDFFAAEFAAMFGLQSDRLLLHLVLPVGISFYTFQALSYSIDVYKGKLTPTRDAVAFFAYISFFPQLVAGPIERATSLLPQFCQKRIFDYALAVDGMRQMLWGFFMKMAVADRCGWYVDQVWSSFSAASPGQLILAAILFSFQIYGDFAGYSNIAIGCAKLFGINLRLNFSTPYFSRDIAEFWRRWHISLNTWFRDYIYIPLGGSREGRAKAVRNTFVIFLVSGLWHGANWTFIVWGAFHALLFLPLLLGGRNRRNTDTVAGHRLLPSLGELMQMLLTFALCTFGWILFRADSIGDAFRFVGRIFTSSSSMSLDFPWFTLLLILAMLTAEWFNRDRDHGLALDRVPFAPVRALAYYALIVVSLLFSSQNENFIYFQF